MNEESLLLILMLESLTGVRSRMHNNLSPTPPYVNEFYGIFMDYSQQHPTINIASSSLRLQK
uniref:Uncharacterized protein n=1 Tax=Helianthus annuus TaxID=4232 RepID=A0A251SSZ4_HELAN